MTMMHITGRGPAGRRSSRAARSRHSRARAAQHSRSQQLSGWQHCDRHPGAPAVPGAIGDLGAALPDLRRPGGVYLDGTETISRKAEWPDWYPPEEMRERDGRLPEKMTGGIKNPLGAMALYLGKSLYRIHGTNDAKSIGRAASSGCFRMLNAHIVDLASRVQVGTPVTVVHRLPPELDRVVAQQVGDPNRQRASRSIERF